MSKVTVVNDERNVYEVNGRDGKKVKISVPKDITLMCDFFGTYHVYRNGVSVMQLVREWQPDELLGVIKSLIVHDVYTVENK